MRATGLLAKVKEWKFENGSMMIDGGLHVIEGGGLLCAAASYNFGMVCAAFVGGCCGVCLCHCSFTGGPIVDGESN